MGLLNEAIVSAGQARNPEYDEGEPNVHTLRLYHVPDSGLGNLD